MAKYILTKGNVGKYELIGRCLLHRDNIRNFKVFKVERVSTSSGFISGRGFTCENGTISSRKGVVFYLNSEYPSTFIEVKEGEFDTIMSLVSSVEEKTRMITEFVRCY